MVVCGLRSCLGLAVTRVKGLKMDSLSPCVRSMGLSEDRGNEEEEEIRPQSPCHLTHSHTHSCDPSALAILTEQVLAAERSESACSVISLVLFKRGRAFCQNTSAESKDAQMLRTMR